MDVSEYDSLWNDSDIDAHQDAFGSNLQYCWNGVLQNILTFMFRNVITASTFTIFVMISIRKKNFKTVNPAHNMCSSV